VGAGCTPITVEAGEAGSFLVELGTFSGAGCFETQTCALETGECVGPGDDCVDLDEDGLGDGTLGNAGCADATTDANDGDATICADTDGDSCDDCSSGSFDPNEDGADSDGDGICDAGDVCVDSDGDGLGDGTFGNAGCVDTMTDSDDGNANVCADTDGDGCDDCARSTFDPSDDGQDQDGDGICVVNDCDDSKPLCASVCTDVDDDGYCIDTDCDDTVDACTLDCSSNADGDTQVDCFEAFCGSDPGSGASGCVEATTELEYEDAINAANARPGHDYIVVHGFAMTTNPPGIKDNAGLTIRQVAGAALTVDAGGDVLVFNLQSANNVIDGVRILNARNARDVVEIIADGNTVQNCEFLGFERRGIYVNGGNDAQLIHNVITGGTESIGSEKAGIVLRASVGSVISGNTVTLNTMDGIQVRGTTSAFIDHNTVADNGGSGIALYGDPSSAACVRNNNITGNGMFGLSANDVVTFDVSAACTGPLSSGPAYGNNGFGNISGACGGGDCVGCGCLPSGLFWEYGVDPFYISITADERAFYCLDPSSSLVDGADDLLVYDLNGDAAGDFNGTAPDVGSREDGPGDCD
jgi:parallel beta-helix repeat protein